MADFGTVFCDNFSIALYKDGEWQAPSLQPLAPEQQGLVQQQQGPEPDAELERFTGEGCRS